jgi:cellulose synthase/poly-beta-1,6-N-acetylglucosamine synthase-like glycosyltransferase
MDVRAIENLARWFIDPQVGAVCGRLILTDAQTGCNVDSAYWRYETFLKGCEARLGGLLGANGAIYAIRRSDFVPLPPGTLVDDLVAPLLMKIRSRCRIIYDIDAKAFEESAPDLYGEYRRRTRIGTGGFQSLTVLWPLLLPQFGWTAFSFWSHKVLRWFCPFCMIAAMLSCCLLLQYPLYRGALLAQLLFYAVCGIGAIRGAGKSLRICTMFACMNLALLMGFIRWLSQRQSGMWLRTQRA